MAVSQLSIFAENKRGGLVDLTSLLAQSGVDLRALSLADTQDYGIVRLIVSDVDHACAALRDNGIVYSVTQVLAVALDDKPGSLARAMQVLSDGGIDLEYMYAFLSTHGYACAIVRVSDNETAEQLLKDADFKLLTQQELGKL